MPKKKKNQPAVSSLACEELRSHHSILTTSKKLNKLKNQQLFLEKWGYKENLCPRNWRDKKVDTEKQLTRAEIH